MTQGYLVSNCVDLVFRKAEGDHFKFEAAQSTQGVSANKGDPVSKNKALSKQQQKRKEKNNQPQEGWNKHMHKGNAEARN